MKMTMHVDEALLERVMKVTGADNKTRAVDIALRELDRRHELMRLAEAGLGLSADDLRKACDSATLIDPIKSATPVRYVGKTRSR